MEESVVSKKTFFILLCTSICIVVFVYVYTQLDKSTKFIVCNSGKRLSIYIRVHNKTDIIVNPDGKQVFLQCIGNAMPFYDRNIEIVFLTESSKSEDLGIILQRFTVGKLILNSKNELNFKNNSKITSVINGKELLTLRVRPDVSIRMYKSPRMATTTSTINSIAYWEGKKSVLFTQNLRDRSTLREKHFDYIVLLGSLKLSDMLEAKGKTGTKNVVLMKVLQERELYTQFVSKFFPDINFIEVEKYGKVFVKVSEAN